jgi:hypothetical protein
MFYSLRVGVYPSLVVYLSEHTTKAIRRYFYNS